MHLLFITCRNLSLCSNTFKCVYRCKQAAHVKNTAKSSRSEISNYQGEHVHVTASRDSDNLLQALCLVMWFIINAKKL